LLTVCLTGFVALAVALLGVWSAPAAADTFRVRNTADSGPDSLRRAITQANSNAGADAIRFRIAGAGVKTIRPASPLPDITDPVTVNGYSQPGASANTLAQGSDAVLLIQLNGADAGAANGLTVEAGDSTIRGLVINRFAGNGIILASAGNVVAGNFIGTDASGTARRANSDDGVDILGSGSDNNTVGGVAAADRNVLSGNAGDGVQVGVGLGTTGNQVIGNYIGTDKNGVADLGNTEAGVLLFSVQDNVVGGTNSAARNVISGNGGGGVRVLGNSSLGVATGNQVLGNFVGTDAGGTADLGNTGAGVEVQDARVTSVGGGVASARNVISGNDGQGVAISGNLATDNLVLGNFVGTDAAGTADLGNGGDGVQISSGADANTVGGTDSAKLNVISGNGGDGVDIVGGLRAADNQILGNHIGTDEDGTTALGNAEDGVHISAESNTVGGTVASARNVISGNLAHGVQMIGEGAFDNVVSANYIGTDAGGTASLGNGLRGVQISSGANGNTVGGTVAGARNVISGNLGDGVQIGEHPPVDPPARQNTVLGNFIGVDATGNAALPNRGGDGGVDISNADDNTIGGTTAAARNVISGNANDGVVLFGTEATGNDVQGNFIGLGANGTTALGNDDGVVISSASDSFVGGGSDASNRIAHNDKDGVIVAGGLAVGNRILSNSIFSNGDAVATDELGIDLAADGVTANDEDDADNSGSLSSNRRQNFPVISSAIRNPATGVTTISGSLNSNPNERFRIQCFVAAPDPSGHGEGQNLVGIATATTDANGDDDSWVCTDTTLPQVGQQVTATATRSTTGDTSEFADNEPVQGP
jgi:hypothetical protein